MKNNNFQKLFEMVVTGLLFPQIWLINIQMMDRGFAPKTFRIPATDLPPQQLANFKFLNLFQVHVVYNLTPEKMKKTKESRYCIIKTQNSRYLDSKRFL